MKSNSYVERSANSVSFSRNLHPSVPMSVYREIVEQLQTAQAQLSDLEANNQQLIYRNHLLQKEVERLMNSAYQIKHLANHEVFELESKRATNKRRDFPNKPLVLHSSPTQQSRKKYQAIHKKPDYKVKTKSQAHSFPASSKEKSIASVKYIPPPYSSQQKNSQEMNGWFLAIAILLIILTAFTSGFLLVRPLLNHNRN